MAKRLTSPNRRRGRNAKREVEGRLGDIPRSDIDAAVATAFEVVSQPTEEAITPPPEVALAATLATPPLESSGSQPSTINYQPSGEPLPARMLNEFVYCPRLFYYEFVEGVFVHNADTMRGAAIHTRVDSGSGALPPAEGGKSETEEPEVIHSRSVSLGSERLGVTAKIDLVEVHAAQTDNASDGRLQSGCSARRRRRQGVVGRGQDAARSAMLVAAR